MPDEKAEDILVKNYMDDFSETLPIFPFKRDPKSSTAKTHLKRASEKAAKSIQKHSMNINGVEKNAYIDDAVKCHVCIYT